MRLKTYEILTNLPKDSYLIFDKEVKASLKEILEPQHDLVKIDYLFNSNTSLKEEYELGKKVLDLIE